MEHSVRECAALRPARSDMDDDTPRTYQRLVCIDVEADVALDIDDLDTAIKMTLDGLKLHVEHEDTLEREWVQTSVVNITRV